MYGYESWIRKKANKGGGREQICSKMWCCKRALLIPWTARKTSKLILGQIKSELSLEAKMTKLSPLCFGCSMKRQDLMGGDNNIGEV